MRRVFGLMALVAMMVGLIAPSLASAQTGTPAAETSGGFGVPVGTSVPYVGSDGAVVGSVTVDSISDPFEGFDSYSPPQRGYHYSLIDVTIANTSNRPLDVSTISFLAVDSDGFVAEQAYISYTDPSITDLDYSATLAPGDSISGALPYSLFGTSTIEQIYFYPTYDRLVTALDLRTVPAEIGTPVSIMNTSGAEAVQVSVDSVMAPFEGYDASSAPPRGSSYVAIQVTVTNTSSSVLSVSSSDFQVVDAEGFLLSSTYVGRTDTTVPDYDYADLAPGASQTGIIVYQIYQGVPVAKVLYGDAYTSLAVVADVAESTATSGAATGAPAAPTATTAAANPTTAAEPTVTTAAASSADCVGVVEWGTDLAERIGRAAALVVPFQSSDVSTLDPVTVRDVGVQLRALGDEQAASNPPAAAVPLNSVLTDQFYYALADAVDQIAGALEQNNAAAAMTSQMTAMGVIKVFDDGGPYDQATQALAAACPAEIQQLDQHSGS